MVQTGTGDLERYEFRVKGELDVDWYYWFDGFEVTASSGETLICGPGIESPGPHIGP